MGHHPNGVTLSAQHLPITAGAQVTNYEVSTNK